MIFLVQFGMYNFQKPQIALAFRARAILLVFEIFTTSYHLFQIAFGIIWLAILIVMFFFSWWNIASQLGLSLLDLSDGLNFFKSADSVSKTVVHVLYAAYLVMALILLINLLIALLTNTYQRVQVGYSSSANAYLDWSMI